MLLHTAFYFAGVPARFLCIFSPLKQGTPEKTFWAWTEYSLTAVCER